MRPPSLRRAVVIGGGFFGCSAALYLQTQLGVQQVTILERGPRILGRASYFNQARIHNGYHYPRSYTTAFRSRINLPRFVDEFGDCVERSFTKIYAITQGTSKVTARQFGRFCREIGARLEVAPPALRRLFSPRLGEEVFLTDEHAFNATVLAEILNNRIQRNGVDLRLDTAAIGIATGPDGRPVVRSHQADGTEVEIEADLVLNCTYAALPNLGIDLSARIKLEITELALVEVPEEIRELGVTVMDGAFFSLMPFPARGLHSLSHVRYTPHIAWSADRDLDPYKALADYGTPSRFDLMRRDAARYMPAAGQTTQVDTHFEVKAVLAVNESDDGRPILFEPSSANPRIISVLGGKLDNIYDAYAALNDLVPQVKAMT